MSSHIKRLKFWVLSFVLLIAHVALVAPVGAAMARSEALEEGIPADPVAGELAWSTRDGMGIPRIDFGVVAVNGKLYAVGGFSGSNLAVVEEYDPVADTWTRKSDMLTPRRNLVVATANGKVYAIGGMQYVYGGDVTYSFANEEYDPTTDTWTPKAPIPMEQPFNDVFGNAFIGGAGAVGKIYVMVYNTVIPGTTATYEYDPAQDSWDKNKAPVPFNRTRYSVAALNNRIYALATSDRFTYSPGALAEYDPIEDRWTIKHPASERLDLALAATGEKLYALGGITYSPATVQTTVEVFDPMLNAWELAMPMPTGRHSLAAAAIGETIYAIGGADEDDVPLTVTEALETGDVSPTRCDLDIRFSNGLLTLDFGLATPQTVKWGLWLTYVDQTLPLWSVELPPIGDPIPYSVPIPGFPSVGRVGFLTTFGTQTDSILCSEWRVIDTGPVLGSSQDILHQILEPQ